MTEHYNEHQGAVPIEPPVSFSHIAHVLRAYRTAIIVSLLSVGLAYGIIALSWYLIAPSRHTTSLPFRLDFQGASEGHFPNGTKFFSSDIVAAPILLKVYGNNHLDQFTTFQEFSNSVFILESNAAYEALANEYQARLSDPRLGPVDRERIQKEFDQKRASLSKDQYTINYAETNGTLIPQKIVRKTLVDILNAWADVAVTQQHVFNYSVGMVSPSIVNETAVETNDPIVAAMMLRLNIRRVLDIIHELRHLAGAELARTDRDRVSLGEVSARLEDITRFKLEPLTSRARAAGLVRDVPATIQFVQSQLGYDQRKLQAAKDDAESIRQSFAVYVMDRAQDTAKTKQAANAPAATGTSEPVMPVISENFIDRLVNMTSNAADTAYRQGIVTNYQDAMRYIAPLEQAVTYDQMLLDQLKNPVQGTGDPNAVRAELAQSRAEIRDLIAHVVELHLVISRSLSPSSQVLTLTAPPTARTERALNITRVAIFGILVILIALPMIVGMALLRNRIREEEIVEEAEHTHPTAVARS